MLVLRIHFNFVFPLSEFSKASKLNISDEQLWFISLAPSPCSSLTHEGGSWTRWTMPGLHFNAIINCVACVVTKTAVIVLF